MKKSKYVQIQIENTIVTSKLMIVQNKMDARQNNKHTIIKHKLKKDLKTHKHNFTNVFNKKN
jgi:hypothetical protein